MMKINFSPSNDEFDYASIQDEEALFLYSLVRANKVNRILEIGGGAGKSSNNFLNAMTEHQNSYLYTIDVLPQKKLADNHITIIKNCNDLKPIDVDNLPLDLIFFDCHEIYPQLNLYNILKLNNLITNKTLLVLHDTNLYYEPYISTQCGLGYPKENLHYDNQNEGYVHQWVERQMVNYFKLEGYDIFSLRTTKEEHSSSFPFRHGISVCQKFEPLKPYYLIYNHDF